MSITSQNLDAFLVCAQTCHFTRAAKLLHITQSALSQRIRNLEEELSVQLFIRDRSGIRLTDAGAKLLQYGLTRNELEKEVLDQINPKSSAGFSGELRIGGFSSVMRSIVLPALAPLMALHPRLRLVFITKELDELPALLKRGEIDYMIIYNEVVEENIEIVHLGDEVNVLVESIKHRPPDIFLDHDANDQTTTRYLKKAGIKKSFPRSFLDDVYGLIDGVKAGLGRAVIPLHLIKDEPEIRIVDRKNTILFPVNLHFHNKSYPSKLHSEVLSHLYAGAKKGLK